jgi:CHAT domain-containing protein
MKLSTLAHALLGGVLLTWFSISVCHAQTFEPTTASRREATARGQLKEYLAAMEALGAEGEKNQRWAEASTAFYLAAVAAQNLGQMEKTIAHGTKAVELGQKAGDPRLQADPTEPLAAAYRSLSQFEKQKEWLVKGIEISKQITNANVKQNVQGRLYGRLGVYFLQRGEYQNAIEHISYSVQQLDSLLTYFKRIRAHLQNAQQTIQTIETNMTVGIGQLGNAYLRAGNIQEAVKAFERSLTLVAGSKLHLTEESNVLRGLGTAYLAQKNYARAMEQFTVALQVAENRRQPASIETASRSIGDLLLQTQREAEAIPYFKKAIDAIESTRSQLGSEEFRTSFFENKGATYGGMIQAQLTVKNFDEAFNYSERARSRSLLDVLGSKVQLSRSAALLEHERALQARISVLRAMTAGREGDISETSELRKQLAEAERDYNEYLAKIRKENKEQASLMSVEPLTLKQVQERLDPGVTMLEYFVAGNNVWLWVVEKDRVEFVSTTIGRKDLVAKVIELRDTIYQLGEKDRFNALSQELYKLLIQPALSHIRGKELIIVPHDTLHYLPFQALLASDGHYLIEKYPIYYLSSASLMQFTKEKRRASGEKVLALGNPDLGDPRMNLEFAELEAKQVQDLYAQSTVFLRRDASKLNAKTHSPQNDIIHFATHAQLNENDPLSSAILLAKSGTEDGRLEVREVFGMDLKANLVVLSACETGLGKLSSGDELVGLTRAFIYAGTPSVVASLWSVDDGSTAQLMASFYKNLKTMTKVEALRQAQLELIRGNIKSELLARRGIGGVGRLGETPTSHLPASNSELPAPSSISVSTSHPYFWAPFILVGEGK